MLASPQNNVGLVWIYYIIFGYKPNLCALQLNLLLHMNIHAALRRFMAGAALSSARSHLLQSNHWLAMLRPSPSKHWIFVQERPCGSTGKRGGGGYCWLRNCRLELLDRESLPMFTKRIGSKSSNWTIWAWWGLPTVYIYIYIYIERERERSKPARSGPPSAASAASCCCLGAGYIMCIHISMHIYIYTYTGTHKSYLRVYIHTYMCVCVYIYI